MEDTAFVSDRLAVRAVLAGAQLPPVLNGAIAAPQRSAATSMRASEQRSAYRGAISLYNSKRMRPAGVLPMETSKKTIGRAEVAGLTLDMM